MSDPVQIFVKLLDEGVDVWRPVQAERQVDDAYKIVDQPYNREIEEWEFGPGEVVVCEMINSSDGQILAATRLQGPSSTTVPSAADESAD
jgi:hypothetical protein